MDISNNRWYPGIPSAKVSVEEVSVNKEDFEVDDEMRVLAEKITQEINNHIANVGKKVFHRRDKY